MSKHQIKCTVNELIEDFNKDLEKFTKHVFSTTSQFKSLKTLKENLQKNEVYLTADFSQSYNCQCGREIQGAHFGASKKLISIHSRGFYFKNEEGKINFESFVVISDDLPHDACAVWALLEPIIGRITELLPSVETIHFQTDGPSTQYKNKTNFYLFHRFMKELSPKHATWNFTTAGRGKSVADGIGGSVKEMSDRYVACGNDITCAEDMKSFIDSSESRTKCYIITAENIAHIRQLVPENLKAVKDTTKVHQFV